MNQTQHHQVAIPISSMHLAWLMRSDARRGVSTDDAIPQWFQLWWLTQGRLEYPDSALPRNETPLPPALLAPLPDQPRHGHFGLSPLLRHLLELRADLRQTFDVSTKAGLWQAMAWLFAYGLHEYHLVDKVDAATRAALDEPPPPLALPAGVPQPVPGLTWLMFFVWRNRTDIQTRFDLRTVTGQTDYLAWFLLHLAPEHHLTALLPPRWCAWLREPLALADNPGPLLPRASILLWQQRADLQQSFDLQTPQGRAALAAWPLASCDVDPTLWWVAKPPDPPASPRQPDPAFAKSPASLPLQQITTDQQPQNNSKLIAAHADLKSAVAKFNALGDTLVLENADWLA